MREGANCCRTRCRFWVFEHGKDALCDLKGVDCGQDSVVFLSDDFLARIWVGRATSDLL